MDWRFLGHITQRRLLAHGSEKCEKLTGILMDRFSMFLFPLPVACFRFPLADQCFRLELTARPAPTRILPPAPDLAPVRRSGR